MAKVTHDPEFDVFIDEANTLLLFLDLKLVGSGIEVSNSLNEGKAAIFGSDLS